VGVSPTTSSAQTPTIDQQLAQLRAEHEGIHQMIQRAQVMAVTYQLDTAGLHGIDEGVAAGSIPAGALGSVRRARIAVQATSWPEPMRETATSLASEMMHLEAALRDEKVAEATGPAHEVHEIGHRISDQAYTWLSGSSAPPASDHDHDMEMH
jgi:hypothetical protein